MAVAPARELDELAEWWVSLEGSGFIAPVDLTPDPDRDVSFGTRATISEKLLFSFASN